jgi:porin
VVLDGVPGDPADPAGTQIIFGDHDGVLMATEIAYVRGTCDACGAYGKYALGGWVYTADFDDIVATDRSGQPVRRGGTHGMYGLAEQTVFREATDSNQGLALFVRLGFADTRVHQVGVYSGGGLVYTGLLPQRSEDCLGFGVAAAHNSSRFGRIRRIAGRAVEEAEVALELTYWAALTPWFALQPSLQYIINPSTEPTIADAVVFGLRFAVAF